MSRRSTDAGRQAGLTRSSSSSSSSSTSTSSSSSSSHHIRAERSRSRSSSGGSSRSRSRTRSRERHYNKREDCAEDNRDRSDARIASRSRQQQDYQDEQQSHHEDSSSDLIDDSIRSDKSSKSSSSNGRYGDAAASQRDSVPTAAITTPKPSPKAVSARITKTAIQFGKPGTVARPGIHMKLSQGKPQPEQPKKITVASAFNNDSDDEVEEMPPECKMRMRNIGRDTPTSSGPNSFGKTKQGFIDSKKLFEKSLRQAAME